MIVLASHVHFCLLMVTLVAAKFSDELFVMQLGYFRICLDVNDPFLIVTHMSDSTKVLFKTIQSLPFITIGYATDSRPPIVDGNFKVNEWTLFETPYQNIQEVQTEHQNEDVITGEVWGLVTQAKYKIRFYVPEDDNGVLLEHQLAFTINVTPLQGSFNRVFLNYWCDGKENFYGFGTQYSHWNLKGRRIPVLVSEQGIGRGAEPLTTFLNVMADRAGGDWSTSYAPKPLYITNFNRSIIIENSEITFFDTRDDDSVTIEVWASSLRGRILHGTSVLELITQITAYTGRMSPLPAWTQRGATVGLEGGTAEVLAVTKKLLQNPVPVPIVAVWVQDWVGLRHAFDGDRLDWNWALDEQYYPDWRGLVSTLACRGIRMLSYVNPFFSNSHDPYGGSAYVRCRPKPTSTSTQGTDGTIAQQTPDTDETLTVAGCSGPSRAATPIAVTNATKAPTLSRNLYQEGMQHKYFVQSPVPGVGAYKFHSGSIEFCMLDLTNPAARTWMKAILREQMLRDTGVSGWMADFGEYLPFDAVLHDGSSGAEYHNKYPEEWARLNYEAVQEYQHECESFKYEEESRKESADESIVTPSNTDTEHLLPARQRRSVPLISQLLSFVFNFRLPFYSRRQSASHSHRHMADNTIGIKKNNAPPSTVTVSHFIETGAAEVDSSPRSDIMYFIRSAWLQSPKYVSAFWLGDQMVSWDRHDGIKTVLLGALSSGIGGHSLTHSDIGGYTMQDAAGPLQYVRSRELLMRWSELEAFGSALYRSHVGLSSSSPLNAQIYDDCTSITHFALFASIFAELAPYREKLMQEAHEHGWPLIRPMAAYFGYDEVCWELTAQYMFGPDFLVAPVLDPATSPVQTRGSAGSQCSRLKHRSSTSTGLSDNATADSTTGIGSAHEKLGCTAADFACWGIATVKVYLPRHSEWVHLWSGAQVSGGAHGRYVSVQAPVAAPPVFFRPGSESGHALREFVLRRGMGVCVRTSRSSGRDPGSVSGPVSSDSAECAQVGLNDTGVMHRHATTIAEIVDHVDRDWYDWLGIKQYAAANIYI